MLIYSICYYYGKNKKENIKTHLKVFNKIKDDKKFFVVVMIDNVNEQDKILLNLSNEFKGVNFIPEFNWGGTIAGLQKIFYTLINSEEKYFIAHFEEDFYAVNDEWFEKAKFYLKDNIYVGEGVKENKINKEICEVKIQNNRKMNAYKNILTYQPEVWTDGGFYFTTLNNLKKINNKCGDFHKGNKLTKYHHGIDGIDLGEVGFPTMLYHNNFKFCGLYRNKFFIHKT